MLRLPELRAISCCSLWHNTAALDAPVSKDVEDAAAVELAAVVVAVTGEEPRVLTLQDGRALPSGPLESAHRTLQTGLRSWVERQTHHPLGYIEQLYTFADRDRTAQGGEQRVISISYLGLTREGGASGEPEAGWQSWYAYFPWEDRRSGVPEFFDDALAPQLRAWADTAADPPTRRERRRNGCCSATSCCTRRGWCRKRCGAVGGPPEGRSRGGR
jgi:hypothetical protein